MLSFLLLWRAFRAPVIALKAGVFTILSILAAYGVVAYVAEGGWAGQLIGNRVRKRLTFDPATEGQDHGNPSNQAETERAREDSNL